MGPQNNQPLQGKYTLKDLVKADRLSEQFERFSRATGLVVGLVSLTNHELLVGSLPDKCPSCRTSLSVISGSVSCKGVSGAIKGVDVYSCECGVVYGTMPVTVKGAHAGCVFSLQPTGCKDSPGSARVQVENALSFLSEVVSYQAECGLEARASAEPSEHARKTVSNEASSEHRLPGVTLAESDFGVLTLLGNLPGMVYRCQADQEWTMLFVSEQCLQLTGYQPDDLLLNRRLSYNDIIHPDDRQYVWTAVQRALTEDKRFELTYRIQTLDGTEKWVWEQGVGIYSDSGELIALEGFITDITKRIRAEEALRSEKEFTEAALNSQRDTFFLFEADSGKAIRWNRVFNEITGYTDAEIASMPAPASYYSPDDLRRAKEFLRDVMNTGGGRIELELICKDGRRVPTEYNVAAITLSDDKPSLIISIGRDITERKKSEEALRDNRERLLRAQHVAGMGFVDWDLRTGKTTWSDEIYHLLGIEPVGSPQTVESTIALVHPDDVEAVRRSLEGTVAGTGQHRMDHRMIRSDGKVLWIHGQAEVERDENGEPAFLLGTVLDITERKHVEEAKSRIEEQYHQVQKVESIGRLAGGISHDLNNLLSPIIGFGEMLQGELCTDEVRREYADQILQAGFRARDLVRQLLAFSRKQTLDYQPVDMNKTVVGLEKLLRRTIPEDIQITFRPSSEVPRVMADIGQIEQVIVNLAVNAHAAMPDGGELVIETAQADLGDEDSLTHQEVEPGRYVLLAMSDNGCGMDDETMDHMFEPFFSTKGEQGTGLGLATVYGIVKQHGGGIRVHSRTGKGTRVEVYLPITDNAAIRDKSPAGDEKVVNGSETILLVEDNEQVRKLSHTILVKHGYKVLPAARDGQHALDIIASYEGPVHLLLTDVVMPEMNGRELYARIADRYPGLKVLYMSGYTEDVIGHRGVLDEGVSFIQKPFTVQSLATKVNEVLRQD